MWFVEFSGKVEAYHGRVLLTKLKLEKWTRRAMRCVILIIAATLLVSSSNEYSINGESERIVSTAGDASRSVDVTKKRRNARKEAVLFVAKSFADPYFRDMEYGVREGFREIAGDYELIVRAGRGEGDVKELGDILISFLIRHRITNNFRLHGVILAAGGVGAALVDAIKQLNYADIPIVNVDTNISQFELLPDKVRILTFIGSNDLQGGALAANILATHLPRGGRVLVLNGASGEETANERRRGFLDAIRQINTENVKYAVMEWTADGLRDQARSATRRIIASMRRIDAIVAANDHMALGAMEGIRSGPRNFPEPAVIIGYDGIDEARKAVDNGQLTATLYHEPKDMGRKAINVLCDLWAHKEVKPQILIPVKAYRVSLSAP